MSRATRAVGLIAFAQFLGTSLWFSINGAADDLAREWGASAADIGTLTSAVQLGFIAGTLVLGLTGLADRFRASRVFAFSAIVGAAWNAGFAVLGGGLASGAVLRFGVGVCLAGVYPIGMKMIVGWAPERAGAALALLVGMLTLGTAFPHAVKAAEVGLEWRSVILVSSLLAVIGAAIGLALGDGPHLPAARKAAGASAFKAFACPRFRAPALGYFGHMWELYAFWTVVPMLVARADLPLSTHQSSAALSFEIIGAGAIGCVIGGWASKRTGSERVAAAALLISGSCCLLVGAMGEWLPSGMLMLLLFVWGAAVIADSPQFSALSSQACPRELVGSALAIQNSIGFALTMISISLCTRLVESWGWSVALVLLLGPIVGLAGFLPALARSRVAARP